MEDVQQEQKAMDSLRASMMTLYPELEKRSYFLPPVHFNHEAFQRKNIAGQVVLVTSEKTSEKEAPPHHPIPHNHLTDPEPPDHTLLQESHIREDISHQHVLHCLQALADYDPQEVMFTISKLSYSKYLSKPSFAEAAQRLPRPYTLPRQYRRGEFNILVIHQRYGILIGEIKAVGLNACDLNKPQDQADDDIARRVEKAVKQLDKAQKMVAHLVSDLSTSLCVQKTLMLPYVSCKQLQNVLAAHSQLKEVCCQCLEVATVAEVVELCLCSDFVSDRSSPWLTNDCLPLLQQWWRRLMAKREDFVMTNELYVDLVTRFGGPATTVDIYCVTPPRMEVRTEGQAVSETGQRLTRLILTPKQVHLLTSESSRLVALEGPPGTGKTVMLVLVGLQWLLEGRNVFVVSLHLGSRAASRLIHHQLTTTLTRADHTEAVPRAGKAHLLLFNLLDEKADVMAKVVNTMRKVSGGGELYVLCDEFCSGDFDKGATCFKEFVTQLSKVLHHLNLWAAAMRYSAKSLPGFQVESLTVPLRCTPVVQREVELAMEKMERVSGLPLRYTASAMPAACDGPGTIRILHKEHEHKSQNPADCYQCGQIIAHVVRHQLQVGQSALPTDIDEDVAIHSIPPPGLEYRDVFVLINAHLQDDSINSQGQVITHASPLVQGLRDSSLPIAVVKNWDNDRSGWEGSIAEVVTSSRDAITVANFWELAGLERKVVVVVQGILSAEVNEHQTDSKLEKKRKLQTLVAMTRCTSQLIVVEAS